MPRTVTIAAAQYRLDPVASLDRYEAKITGWVEDAAGQGAELLVFPEYGAMELAAVAGKGADLEASFDAVSDRFTDLDRVHGALAAKHGVAIVAGSGPRRRGDGCMMNTARIFGPTGTMGSYDKMMPTPWERSVGKMTGGRELAVYDAGKAKIGLLICYDIEFPLLARALAEAGAEVIVAPSNTESEWGYWRVRTGCAARALENQLYTVHAPTVGAAPWCTACAMNVGAAAIFAPSDRGFPPGGIMALGEMNRPQWVQASVDLDLIAEVRATGGVQIYKHWLEQPGAAALPPARIIGLA
jgi:predicted amidohydrolase